MIPQRITNAHRAAVCGLLLAGVPIKTGCQIVGAPYEGVKAVLPASFLNNRPVRKYRGQLLLDLEAAYTGNQLSMRQIEALYGISGPNLCKLAEEHEWPRRNAPKASKIIARMPQPQQASPPRRAA